MKFNATSRSDKGTSASRRLRHAGRVPAIVYGGTADPLSIELDHNEIYHALRKEEFHASILDMDLDGKKRSEEHTSELQSLMRISYAVFCLKKKNKSPNTHTIATNHT